MCCRYTWLLLVAVAMTVLFVVGLPAWWLYQLKSRRADMLVENTVGGRARSSSCSCPAIHRGCLLPSPA